MTGYRATRTLSVPAEWRRQARRRRTQLTLGFMVALPLIILAAFQLGGDSDEDTQSGGGAFGSLADLATGGGLNFALFSVFVSAGFLLVVVVALFFGDSVASEASWGSLRYLLAGTLRYGWTPLRSVVAAELAPVAGLGRFVLVLGYLAVGLLVVAGLAFLLSVVTDAPLGAVGGAVLLFILSSILDQVTALGALRTLLPTHFSGAWLGLLSTPMQLDEVVRGSVSALVYAGSCCALAWWRFLRKDIVS